MIKFTCSNCQDSFKVSDKYSGKNVRCPSCTEGIKIPEIKKTEEKIQIIDPVEIKKENIILIKLYFILWSVLSFFLFVISLGLLSTSLISSLFFLCSVVISLPIFNNIINKLFKQKIDFKNRIGIIVILIIAGFISYASDVNKEKDNIKNIEIQKQETILKLELEENIDEIKEKIKTYNDNKDYTGLIKYLDDYKKLNNNYINQVIKETKEKIIKEKELSTKAMITEEKIQEIKRLEFNLSKVNENNNEQKLIYYKEIESLYKELENTTDQVKKYSNLIIEENKIITNKKIVKEKEASGIVWSYSTSVDKMSEEVIYYSSIKSINTVNFDFPYNGTQRAELVLRKHPRSGTSIMFSLNKAHFLCNRTDCHILIKFDDDPAQEYKISYPADLSRNLVFIEENDDLTLKFKKSKKILIEAMFYNHGKEVFEFNSENYVEQIK